MRAVIGLQPEAGRAERFAAAELGRYLTRMTRRHWPVETDPPPDRPGVRLCLEPADARTSRSDTEADSFRLCVREAHRVEIAAGSPRALVYGVYALLERLGCRFLAPGPENEIVPRRSRQEIFRLPSVREQPAFAVRGVYFHAPIGPGHLAIVDWLAKNRFNTVTNTAFAWDKITAADQRRFIDAMKDRGLIWAFGHHSYEYFLRRGRGASTRMDPHAWRQDQGEYRWCPQNPRKVAELQVGIEDFLKAFPECDGINLWPNDGAGAAQCRCPACEPIYWNNTFFVLPALTGVRGKTGQDHNSQNLSPQNIDLLERVGRWFDRRFPGKQLDGIAYCGQMPAPAKQIRAGFTVSFANYWRDYRHPVSKGSPRNAVFGRALAGWNRALNGGDRLHLYEYFLGFMTAISSPFYLLNAMRRDLALYRRTGLVAGLSTEVEPCFWTPKPVTLYLLARQLWGPIQAPEPLVREFSLGYFGAAAGEMIRFYEACEAAYERLDHYTCDQDAVRRAMTPAVMRRLRALVRQGLAKTRGKTHARLRGINRILDFTALLTQGLTSAAMCVDLAEQGRLRTARVHQRRAAEQADALIAFLRRNRQSGLFITGLYRPDDFYVRYIRQDMIQAPERAIREGMGKTERDAIL